MDKDALKAAIGKRRGQGLNLNIMIEPQEDPDEKMTDVAPEVNDKPEEEGEESFEQMLAAAGGQLPIARKKGTNGQENC